MSLRASRGMTFRRFVIAALGACCLPLVACSPGQAGQAGQAPAAAAPAPATQAPAGQSGAAGTPEVQPVDSNSSACPPFPEPQALDFWGVELGMTPEKVTALVDCLGPAFKLQTSQVPLGDDPYGRNSVPFFLVTRGEFGQQEELNVSFAGAPGALRAVRLSKTINWPTEAPGSRRGVETEMAKIYGPFTRTDPAIYHANTYGQVADAAGAPISPKDPVFALCATFAIDRLKSFNAFLRRYDPMPDRCGRVISFYVVADSNVSDDLQRVTLGTYDYGDTVAALKESLAGGGG